MMSERLIHALMFTPLRPKKAVSLDAKGKPLPRVPRWGLPGLLLSTPGAAKTEVVEAWSYKWGFPCVTLSPGTHGEGAFGVTPVPYETFVADVKKTLLGYPPPEYVEQLARGGVLFLDEITTAAPALQPPMLGFIQNRQVGFYRFHSRVRVIGAGNPVGVSAGGYTLSAPVSNRMGWIDWTPPTEDEWGDWLVSEGGDIGGTDGFGQFDAEAEETRVLREWPAAWSKASGLVSAFHRRKRGMLSMCPKEGDPKLSGPWASHRTWEYAARALAASFVHQLDRNETEILVGSFVGEGARDEFVTFLDKQDLPDAAGVLDGTIPWKHEPTRLDRTYVLLSTCVALVVPVKSERRNERAARMWQMIGEVDAAGAVDVTEPFAALLSKNGLHTIPAARPVLARERELLARAGVKPKVR